MAWEIAFIIFLLSLTVLVYLTIPLVLRLKDTLKKTNQALDLLNEDLPDILDNVAEISGTLSSVSKKVESTVDDVAELEHLISNEIKEPLQNIANTIGMLLQLANKLFDRKKA